MSRPLSRIAPEWWDYTTLDAEIIRDAAAITLEDLPRLSRPGFQIVLHDSLEDFYLAEALEYNSCRLWQGLSTNWNSICDTPIFGAWMNGLKMVEMFQSHIHSRSKEPIGNSVLIESEPIFVCQNSIFIFQSQISIRMLPVGRSLVAP